MVGYAGEKLPDEAWQMLQGKGAVLVDVRTSAEWHYVGLPRTPRDAYPLVRISWLYWPDMELNADFVAGLSDQLHALDAPKDCALLFLCRSGVRSRAAAMAMTAAGYPNCFNVTDGFEGDINPSSAIRDRQGWKSCGLPWFQE